MRDLDTPLGRFWIDDFAQSDTRIGITDVETVDHRGPESTWSWSVDQQEVLFAAADEVKARLEPIVPGGWRLVPGTALAGFEAALARHAASKPPSGRKTPPR